jgi:hypothetical protein
MKSVFALGAGLAAAALLVVLVPACSNKTVAAPPPPSTTGLQLTCDEKQCLVGNECLRGDGELKCRRACTSNTDPATNCPVGAACEAGNTPSVIAAGCVKGSDADTTAQCGAFSALGGTHLTSCKCGATAPKGCINAGDPNQWCCNDAPAEVYDAPFCKRITREFTAGPKQWGAPCNPTGGLDKNPDCDTAQGFFCYGTSPADGFVLHALRVQRRQRVRRRLLLRYRQRRAERHDRQAHAARGHQRVPASRLLCALCRRLRLRERQRQGPALRRRSERRRLLRTRVHGQPAASAPRSATRALACASAISRSARPAATTPTAATTGSA